VNRQSKRNFVISAQVYGQPRRTLRLLWLCSKHH